MLGGIVGNNNAILIGSHSGCRVTGSKNTGGITGFNGCMWTSRPDFEGCTEDIISKCHSSDRVMGDHAGGLSGCNSGIIRNSYSTSDVSSERIAPGGLQERVGAI